MLMISS